MFLHKEGCKYYRAIFRNLDLELANVQKNNGGRYSIYDCINSDSLNPLPHLKELLKHVENVESHMASDENVLKKFINTLHSITFMDMKKQFTDPEYVQLTELLQRLKSIESYFQHLKEHVSGTLELITKLSNNSGNSSDPLLEKYQLISRDLETIFNASSNLALSLKKYSVSIQKEKELIMKEESFANDFNKNLMSWFE